jgi:hypothetical protein
MTGSLTGHSNAKIDRRLPERVSTIFLRHAIRTRLTTDERTPDRSLLSPVMLRDSVRHSPDGPVPQAWSFGVC